MRWEIIVSTLFLAESNYTLELIIEELAQLFEQESDRQAVTLLVNWFRQWMKYGKIISEDFAQIERVYLSSEEVKTMLAKSFEENRQVVLNHPNNLFERSKVCRTRWQHQRWIHPKNAHAPTKKKAIR